MLKDMQTVRKGGEKRYALVKLHLRVKTEVVPKGFYLQFNILDWPYHSTIWIIKINPSKICILLLYLETEIRKDGKYY